MSCSAEEKSNVGSLAEGRMVNYTVMMMSDAAKKEIPLAIASTKLSELKEMLAHEAYFGPSVAPVPRQRLFHMGRELKSGGRLLCNLGLGKFNNRMLHLQIRPTAAEGASRKRPLAGVSQQPTEQQQQHHRQPHANNNNHEDGTDSGNRNDSAGNAVAIDLVDSDDDDDDDDHVEESDLGHVNSLFSSRAMSSASDHATDNTVAINLLDSSDDDGDNEDDDEIIDSSNAFRTDAGNNNHDSNVAIDLLDSSEDEAVIPGI